MDGEEGKEWGEGKGANGVEGRSRRNGRTLAEKERARKAD